MQQVIETVCIYIIRVQDDCLRDRAAKYLIRYSFGKLCRLTYEIHIGGRARSGPVAGPIPVGIRPVRPAPGWSRRLPRRPASPGSGPDRGKALYYRQVPWVGCTDENDCDSKNVPAETLSPRNFGRGCPGALPCKKQDPPALVTRQPSGIPVPGIPALAAPQPERGAE